MKNTRAWVLLSFMACFFSAVVNADDFTLDTRCEIKSLEQAYIDVRAEVSSKIGAKEASDFEQAIVSISLFARRTALEDEGPTQNELFVSLVDGRSVRQLIILGALISLSQSVIVELDNKVLLSSVPATSDKTWLYKHRADEAISYRKLYRDILDKYAAKTEPNTALVPTTASVTPAADAPVAPAAAAAHL